MSAARRIQIALLLSAPWRTANSTFLVALRTPHGLPMEAKLQVAFSCYLRLLAFSLPRLQCHSFISACLGVHLRPS
jgi:hypothetical protein